MKPIGVLSVLCLCCLQLIGPLEGAAQVHPLELRLGSSLLGSTVKNLQGKDLGTLKDLVVSPGDNSVVEFIPIKQLAAMGSDAPDSYAGHSRVP